VNKKKVVFQEDEDSMMILEDDLYASEVTLKTFTAKAADVIMMIGKVICDIQVTDLIFLILRNAAGLGKMQYPPITIIDRI